MTSDSLTSAAPSVPRHQRLKDLQDYTIGATDGDIGWIDDVYFDDASWTVRHLLVEAGLWLHRRVLVPPGTIRQIDVLGQRLVTNLTRQQVEDSPGAHTERPVSMQNDRETYLYYGYPYYWGGPYRWGPLAFPNAREVAPCLPNPPPGVHSPASSPAASSDRLQEEPAHRDADDPHLRSARAVSGCTIRATDGELGHVVDYLIDLEDWAIRYLIVDPRSWWPGSHVLIPPAWIAALRFEDSAVHVGVSREEVQNAPQYAEGAKLDRDFEARYWSHFARTPYWDRSPLSWRL